MKVDGAKSAMVVGKATYDPYIPSLHTGSHRHIMSSRLE